MTMETAGWPCGDVGHVLTVCSELGEVCRTCMSLTAMITASCLHVVLY